MSRGEPFTIEVIHQLLRMVKPPDIRLWLTVRSFLDRATTDPLAKSQPGE